MLKYLNKVFNRSFICSSGLLVMFIPKCSFFPFLRDKTQNDAVRVFQRVIVDDASILDEDLKILEEEEDILLLDE